MLQRVEHNIQEQWNVKICSNISYSLHLCNLLQPFTITGTKTRIHLKGWI